MPSGGTVFTPLLILLALTIFAKPLIIITLLSIMGYDKRNAFTSGSSLAQISEFSLILVLTVPAISEELFSATILLAIISIALTSYIIKYEITIYNFLAKPLNIFEYLSFKKKEIMPEKIVNKQVILFGYHRMGSIFMKALNRMKKKVLIVDFNPEAITELENQKISHVYGDMANLEFLKKLNFKKARVIISSVQKEQDNLVLLKHLKKIKCKAITFVTANHLYEALNFYDLGADYVILPHLMSGESVSLILEKYLKDKKALNKIKKDHLKHLLEINNETRK